MGFYFPNVDPIYLYRRKGDESDPFLYLEDTGFVRKNSIMMKEIPAFHKDVKAVRDGVELTETKSDSVGVNEFRIDYSTGIAFFNESLDGAQITLKYYGTGFVNIPSARVIISGSNEDVSSSLQDMLDSVDDANRVIAEASDLKFMGDYNSSSQYKKWNFVRFGNATFVALKDIRGLSPHESDSWQLVSSGVGFVGVYDDKQVYSIGSVVSDTERKNLYVSQIMGNNRPLSDTSAWELIITLDDSVENMIATIDHEINKLNNLKQQLIDSDEIRDMNESERDTKVESALNNMNEIMDDFISDEQNRMSNESSRKIEEANRVANELKREDAEAVRQSNEANRKREEDVRTQVFEDAVNRVNNATEEVENRIVKVDNKLGEVDVVMDDIELLLENGESSLQSISSFRHRDAYNAEVSYEPFNIVEYDGGSYMAIQNSVGEPVYNTDYWLPLAKKGRDGTEITVEGIMPDEENNISLGSLELVNNTELIRTKDEIEDRISQNLGSVQDLETLNRENIVQAINELKRKIDDIIDAL